MAHQTHLLLACLISSTYAYQLNVGGRAGWVPNPPENYNNWAERMRFQVNDTLVFKYKKGSNSVLVVNKDAYDKCNTDNPIVKMDDGNSVFKFDRSGPFFFISGNKDDCGKGQKLIVVVLAVRPIPPFTPTPANPPGINSPPSPSPSPAGSSPSPSPAGSSVSPTSSPSPSPAGSSASPTSSPSPSPGGSSASPTSSPPAPAETSPSSSPSTGGSSASPPGSSGESPPGSVSPAAGGGNTPADVNTPNGSQSNHKISAAVLVGIVSAIALGGFLS